jgi:hypothetical protein
MFDTALPAGLKTFAEREFMGEKLLWAARPDRRIHALLSFAVWIFAIPWTAISLLFVAMPLASLYEAYAGYSIGAPKGTPTGIAVFIALFAAPFVAIGVGMLMVPWFTFRKGRRTLFVLTDRRLTVLEGGRTVSVTNIRPEDISGFTRKERPDGRGTLVIEQGYERDSEGDRVRKSTEFGVIESVRKVEEMVRAMKDRRG